MAELQKQVIAYIPLKQTGFITFVLNEDFGLIYNKATRVVNRKDKERHFFKTTTGSFECDKEMADLLLEETKANLNYIKEMNIKEIMYYIRDKKFYLKTEEKMGLFKRMSSYIKRLWKREK